MGELYHESGVSEIGVFPCRLGGVIPVIISALPIDSKIIVINLDRCILIVIMMSKWLC